MMEQKQVLGRAAVPHAGQGVVPEQRGPVDLPPGGMAYAAVPYRSEPPQATAAVPGTRLRVDARRNLESVLRAAREVFGEFGYGAPMEEVARRAGVGVGTVYRRFPSKEVLVQRIAAEEVAWLTAQARESLYGGDGAWEALAGYLARAVSTGAGRLLPPEAFRYAEELGRVPEQRAPEPPAAVRFDLRGEEARSGAAAEPSPADADPRLLLQLLAALVARAGAAGELRPGVTVSDVVLVLTASVPVHAARPSVSAPTAAGFTAVGPQTDGQPAAAPSDRLLQILLDGLRAR
ncbi:helix-turn-helix domain-containing protein [Kitasatospora aureofaciens]|uniref:TetR family transcriptional regulator n=2 Tax=Kitasatospora aureofaciens TaxID=1894 RepID=A0A8H9HIP3_KITAU|nr:TetR/AcrR family transcriptional regulator [Kitasatospora aureofaciens]GGU68088.1 TetR family transcriptional regulator [Kitasatospora aureofaciens]